MNAAAAARLPRAAECESLARHLVGVSASPRLQTEWAAFLSTRATPPEKLGVLDRATLWLLRSGRVGAALADAYCARLRRRGPAFERLVAMLALLECLPETAPILDRPDGGPPAWIVAKLALRAALDGLLAIAAIVLLGPLHVAQWLGSGSEGRR